MASPQNSVRQRPSAKDKKRATTPQPDGLTNGSASENIESLKQGAKEAVKNDWEYKLALGVITALAFLTRFWGISHPNQVVFDEVHFGKVRHQIRRLSYYVWTVLTMLDSSLHTTYNEHTSSTSILPSASSCSRSPAGWLDIMASSCSRILAIRTSQTRSPTWHTGRCLL